MMEDDNKYFPCSEKFEILVSVFYGTEQSAEFKALKAETKTPRTELYKNLKSKLLASTRIKTTLAKCEIQYDLIKAARLVVEAFQVNEKSMHNSDTNTSTLMVSHHQYLLLHM